MDCFLFVHRVLKRIPIDVEGLLQGQSAAQGSHRGTGDAFLQRKEAGKDHGF